MQFPKDFLWGAATASYQIEGSTEASGRGECIWQRFSHTPGRVVNGDTGDVACDHLNRYAEDVGLMQQIGLHAYRFSIAWPRVIPAGTGAVHAEGLAFYDRLVDALLAAKITPYVTLYHWDLPQALQDRGGGWENPDSPAWFADYTAVVTQKLGDRVKNWITLNEPWCTAFLGNLLGMHAPGKQDIQAAYKVAHHLLLAHGQAMGVIRQQVADARAGITLNLAPVHAASDSAADQYAAQLNDGFMNRWFLDPLYTGAYPADMVALLNQHNALDGLDLDAVKSAQAPTDFLGVNYYFRSIVRAADDLMGFERVKPTYDGIEFTEMGWEVYPAGLTELLLRVTRDYAPAALYITENGAAYVDTVRADGAVADTQRVAYLRAHFAAAAEAIAQGAPLKGYFVWSLMDNFEWAEGYTKRFGIIYVDYTTQQRILKDSALYYRDVIAAQ